MTKCEICEIEGLGDCSTCGLTEHAEDYEIPEPTLDELNRGLDE